MLQLCSVYIAWNWFSLLLIISGRYAKYFYSVRIWIHGILGLLAVIFNLIGVSFSDVGYNYLLQLEISGNSNIS